MKLQAIYQARKDGSYGSVTITLDGEKVAVKIGADGVVDIPDDQEAERLIGTGNFVALEGKKSEQAKDEAETMLITNGDQTIDLLTLDKDALLELGRDEMGLPVTGRNSEKSLREAIYEHVTQ